MSEEYRFHYETEAQNLRRQHRKQTTNGQTTAFRELKVIKFADMNPRLDGRPIIKGYLEHEQISLLVGEKGCGKTFFALDRDLHVAAGRDWFGRKVKQGTVVYLAVEAGNSITNRVVAWRREHGFEGKDIPFAVITSPVDLCHAERGDVELVIDTIQRTGLLPLTLLDIDTVNRAIAGGNENSPDDMGSFIHSLDLLRERLVCHVSGIHHFGKEISRGSRGHNSLVCAVDTEVQATHDASTKISTVTITHQRDGPAGGIFKFKLRQVELGFDQDGDPRTTCVVEQMAGEASENGPIRSPPS
jgi:hypothetical protein